MLIVICSLGHIENIGFKATRIRALTGERIVFSNSAMLGSSVLNYKAATYMNRAFTLGFDVNTSDELVEQIPEILTNAVDSSDDRVKVAQVDEDLYLFAISFFLQLLACYS